MMRNNSMKVNKEFMDNYEVDFWTQVKLSVYGLVTFVLFMSLFAN